VALSHPDGAGRPGHRAHAQGCAVDTVADGTIDCPCHGSKFAVADGSVTTGPAAQPPEKKTVAVTGGKLRLG
jgi:Rieske Fe-S protein